MKFAFCILLALIFQTQFLHAQDLPNGGMNIWSNEWLWSDPVPFQSTNAESQMAGFGNGSTQTTDSHGGLYAARLQASGTSFAVTPGAVYLGEVEGNDFETPYPFSGRPDSLVFFAQHMIAVGDMATVAIVFYSGSVQMGNTVVTLTNDTEGYIRYSSPVTWINEDEVDGIGFAAISSGYVNTNPSSILFIDDVQLVYNSDTGDQVPGGDFEVWADIERPTPDGWSTSNFATYPFTSVESSGDAVDGLSAHLIAQPIFGDPDIHAGFISLGNYDQGECDESLVVTDGINLPKSITGYYKYAVEDNQEDSASVYLSYNTYDAKGGYCEPILEYSKNLGPVSDWTFFTVTVPDEIFNPLCGASDQIYFAVGFITTAINLQGEPLGLPGSELFLDQIALEYNVCMSTDESQLSSFDLYPNPASRQLTISNIPDDCEYIELTDMNGQSIRLQRSAGNYSKIDISGLSNGVYNVRIITSKSSYSEKLMIAH